MLFVQTFGEVSLISFSDLKTRMSLFSFSSLFPLPLWKLLLDSVFAMVMWLMIARFVLLIVTPEQTSLLILRHIIKTGGHMLAVARYVIPRKLNQRAHELYLAFLLFLGRYYVLPALADYQINTPADLPFEARIASWLEALISRL